MLPNKWNIEITENILIRFRLDILFIENIYNSAPKWTTSFGGKMQRIIIYGLNLVWKNWKSMDMLKHIMHTKRNIDNLIRRVMYLTNKYIFKGYIHSSHFPNIGQCTVPSMNVEWIICMYRQNFTASLSAFPPFLQTLQPKSLFV